MRRYMLFVSLLLVTLVDCQKEPEFINYPRPDLSIDFTTFEDVGFPKVEGGTLLCLDRSTLADLACDRIAKP